MDKFQERHLIKINSYEFQDGNGVRDKYMIVLNRNEEETFIIHTLTTKQASGFNPPKKGCNTKGKISYFYIPKGEIIGENGFYFPLDTFIFFSNNIRKEHIKALSRYPDDDVKSEDIIDKKVFKSIIDCMLGSEFINYEQADCLTNTRKRL